MRIQSLLSVLLVIGAATIQSIGHSDPYSGSSEFLIPAANSECLCPPRPARNLGVLLFRSNPMIEMDAKQFNDFRGFVQQNVALLQANGWTMTCARQLGWALKEQGLVQYSPRDYEDAYGKVISNGGTIDMANDVATNMRNGALDARMTGKELVWLSQVIPAAANGNWEPYLSTGTESRTQIRQVLALIRSMPDMQGMLPDMDHLLTAYRAQIEEQLVMAACLFRKR